MLPLGKSCEKCGLWQTCNNPYMLGSGSENPVVLVVGEAHGETEDNGGKHLRTLLDKLFDIPTEIRFTNIVRCRPPNNVFKPEYAKHCMEHTKVEIEKYKPKLVLLMGNRPASLLGFTGGITRLNGTVVDRNGQKYGLLYHPAAVLRDRSKEEEWVSGFIGICQQVFGEVEDDWKIINPVTLPEVLAMFRDLSAHSRLAFDTEVDSLEWYGENEKLLMVSFATDDKVAYALELEHSEACWSPSELNQIKEMLKVFFSKYAGQLIGHNIKFDAKVIYQHLGIWLKTGGDSLVVSKLQDFGRPRHSLKYLASIFANMPNYDSHLELYKDEHKFGKKGGIQTYGDIPLSTLLYYAALDAKATLLVFDALYPKLTEKQKSLHDQLLAPLSDALAKMEYNGVAIDFELLAQQEALLEAERQNLFTKIRQDKKVKLLEKTRQEYLDSLRKPDTRAKRKIFEFNPASNPQVVEVLFGTQKKNGKYVCKHYPEYAKRYYGLKPSSRTKTGSPQVNAKTLAKYSKNPLVASLLDYFAIAKLQSTYINPLVSGDNIDSNGKIHGTFNLMGTVTGRMSSKNPNMQTLPRSESFGVNIRDLYKAPEGWHIIEVDYSQAELRVNAAITGCKATLAEYNNIEKKPDLHTLMASKIYNIPISEVDKSTHRQAAKTVNFGVLYGQTPFALAKMLKIDYNEAQEIIDNYFEGAPEIKEFQENIIEWAHINGYTTTITGRKVPLKNINNSNPQLSSRDERTAINSVVQGPAAEFTNASIAIISKKLQELGMQTYLILTVHDSIYAAVPQNEVKQYLQLARDVMENIPEIAKTEMPGVDFSWLACPMTIDAKIGDRIGSLVDYKIKE